MQIEVVVECSVILLAWVSIAGEEHYTDIDWDSV
jgi:hypothetical protein